MEDSMTVILFLDFDGVTHQDRCSVDNLFCRMPLIEEVLREFPHVEIVISSSWREHYSLDDMRDFFDVGMQDRVIDVTPNIDSFAGKQWLPGQGPVCERQWECELWMKENRPLGARWLAIDDRPTWFAPGCQNLLASNPEFGFMPADQVTLRKMLQDLCKPSPASRTLDYPEEIAAQQEGDTRPGKSWGRVLRTEDLDDLPWELPAFVNYRTADEPPQHKAGAIETESQPTEELPTTSGMDIIHGKDLPEKLSYSLPMFVTRVTSEPRSSMGHALVQLVDTPLDASRGRSD
jgi:hypothetical protein